MYLFYLPRGKMPVQQIVPYRPGQFGIHVIHDFPPVEHVVMFCHADVVLAFACPGMTDQRQNAGFTEGIKNTVNSGQRHATVFFLHTNNNLIHGRMAQSHHHLIHALALWGNFQSGISYLVYRCHTAAS